MSKMFQIPIVGNETLSVMEYEELVTAKLCLLQRNKIFIAIKESHTDVFNITDADFESIAQRMIKALDLQEDEHNLCAEVFKFKHGSGLKFCIDNVSKIKQGWMGLSIYVEEKLSKTSSLIESTTEMKKLESFTCNLVRENLEKFMNECLNTKKAKTFREYHYVNDKSVLPFVPSEGFIPMTVENWFPGNISVRTSAASRVLLLDGGGVKGIIEASTLMLIGYGVYLHSLKENEENPQQAFLKFVYSENQCCEYQKTLTYPQMHDLFDVVVGTSTGSLVATGLARNSNHPIQLMEKFASAAECIFPTGFFVKLRAKMRQIFTNLAQYDRQPLMDFLNNEFQGVPPTCPILGVVAQKGSPFSSSGIETVIFSSCTDKDSTIKDAVQASSAAPTYFDKKEIGIDDFVDGGLGSNCPIKEGAKLTQHIALLEKEEYTQSECTISLGCGFGDGDEELPEFGLSWLAKSSSILTDAERNWSNYPDKGKIAIRLNPGRVFEVGQYDLADSAKTEEMALHYLGLLKHPTIYKLPTEIPKCKQESKKLRVVSFQVNKKNAFYEQEQKHFTLHAEHIKVIYIEFNQEIDARNISRDNDMIIIGNVKLWLESKPERKIDYIRYRKKMIQIDLRSHSGYGDYMRIIVYNCQKAIGVLNIKVDSERAFLNEIQHAAMCVFAKNISVSEQYQQELLQIYDEHDGYSYDDNTKKFHINLKFNCLSQHKCFVQNIEVKEKDPHRDLLLNFEDIDNMYPKNTPQKQACKSCGEDRHHLVCPKCKEKVNDSTVTEKSDVYVNKLTMICQGSDIKIVKQVDLKHPKGEDSYTLLTLELLTSLWDYGVYTISIFYEGYEISGSPVSLKYTNAGKADTMLRYYRKNLISKHTPVHCAIKSAKEITKDGSDKIQATELYNYAIENKLKVVLLTYCETICENFVQFKHHMVNDDSSVEDTGYIMAKDVLNANELKNYMKEETVDWGGIFDYTHVLKELRGIPKYRNETPDSMMRKLKRALQQFYSKICLLIGYPQQQKNDKFCNAKIALMGLVYVYRIRIVLQTFSHRKQEYYVKHKYHVFEPRPKNYFTHEEIPDEENYKLEGVIFLDIDQLPTFNSIGILRRYYSGKHTDELPLITDLDLVKKEIGDHSVDQVDGEKLIGRIEKFADENNTKVVLLSCSRKFGEYYVARKKDVFKPRTGDYESVTYLDKSAVHLDEEKPNDDELILDSTDSGPKPRKKVADMFWNEIRFLEPYKEITLHEVKQKMAERLRANAHFYEMIFGVAKDQIADCVKLQLISLAEQYSVKIVLQTYDERLQEYFIRRKFHVIRPWDCADESHKLAGTIFINISDFPDQVYMHESLSLVTQ